MHTITGTQLRSWRTRHGWSREIVAVLTDKSHQTICNAEQQQHDPITPQLQEALQQFVPGATIELAILVEYPIE